jgi:predicted porin
MKKSLLALAVLGAFAGAAQAQTGVTVYGSFDGGVRHQSNVSGGDSKTTMSSNGTYNSNRIGFKGTEDLGGGLNAHFALETGFNTGTGALDNANNQLFNRTALVGLGGAWGSLDLGRQYSINFQTIGMYDPFNYKYTGIIPLAGQGGTPAVSGAIATPLGGSALGATGGLTRLNNDIKYTGTFGPITARVEYALGEVAGSSSNGGTTAVGVGYSGGPFSAGAAYTARKVQLGGAGAYQDAKNWTLGGAYSTGPFRLAVGYAENKQDTGVAAASDFKVKDWWLGGSYSMTPAATLTAGYYETKGQSGGVDGKRKLFIVGATYALSKRTNFYADIDSRRYDGLGGAVLSTNGNNDTQTGISVGINHLF